MNRRKIISVIIGLALCGLIAGIIFSFIQGSKSTMSTDSGGTDAKAREQTDILTDTKSGSETIASHVSTVSKQISAAQRILDLQGKSAKEKAIALYDTYPTSTLSIIEKNFAIEVQLADSVDLHALGLSGRDGLSKKSGLLFVFNQDAYYPFWMKDMSFAIDMIWINADKKIVHIEHAVQPDTYPQSFDSPELARYVLEVASGMAKEFKLEKGDSVDFFVGEKSQEYFTF
ncbi:MAG: hypothetical protein RIQ72_11 [Candidatus Parcubacteria bacterium]|jgi:uncharacterized membrane protein (UPF0127 family)